MDSAASRTPSTVASTCCRCSTVLRIVDDLPPETDVTQSFCGNIGESYLVVPTSNPDEFVERRNGGELPNGSGDPDEFPDQRSSPSSASNDKYRSDLAKARLPPFSALCRVEQIMALASGQSETDHPVCADCLRHVEEEVKRQVDQAAEEHCIYQQAHTRIEEELRGFDDDEAARLEAEICEMEEEERRLLEELAGCDAEEAEIEAELERNQRQEELLRRDEEEFWLNVAEYQLDLEESEEERAATTNAIQYATAELNRLKRTNVLNDMFHIAQDGSFGTINRFRIGRFEEEKVPWEEINAGWGQACLLLDALIKKCQIPLTQYRLLPRGSFSAIQAAGDTLELHSSDGGLQRFFSDRRFDLAMSSFLSCLKEVTRFLQRDPTMRLPFKIEGDKIGGFSVRHQHNQDDRWTKALKYMLTDLKWIIAFAESRGFTERSRQVASAGATAAPAAATPPA